MRHYQGGVINVWSHWKSFFSLKFRHFLIFLYFWRLSVPWLLHVCQSAKILVFLILFTPKCLVPVSEVLTLMSISLHYLIDFQELDKFLTFTVEGICAMLARFKARWFKDGYLLLEIFLITQLYTCCAMSFWIMSGYALRSFTHNPVTKEHHCSAYVINQCDPGLGRKLFHVNRNNPLSPYGIRSFPMGFM